MCSHSHGIAARVLILVLAGLLAAAVVAGSTRTPKKPPEGKPAPALSRESRACLGCHAQKTPEIILQWRRSKHAGEGVGCWECHSASKAEPGGFEHNGVTVWRNGLSPEERKKIDELYRMRYEAN